MGWAVEKNFYADSNECHLSICLLEELFTARDTVDSSVSVDASTFIELSELPPELRKLMDYSLLKHTSKAAINWSAFFSLKIIGGLILSVLSYRPCVDKMTPWSFIRLAI